VSIIRASYTTSTVQDLLYIDGINMKIKNKMLKQTNANKQIPKYKKILFSDFLA